LSTPGGLGGSSPQTTLSGNPRGHSNPPRDRGFLLRRSSPEDTGLREGTPQPTRLSPWPRGLMTSDNCTVLSANCIVVSANCILVLVVCCLLFAASARRGGWGWGASLPGPVSSGEILRSDRPSSRGGLEWRRGVRLSVVQGGEPPNSARGTRVSHERCGSERT